MLFSYDFYSLSYTMAVIPPPPLSPLSRLVHVTYWLGTRKFGRPLQELGVCGVLYSALYRLDEQSLKLVSRPL